jgi:hypothetical protein
MLRLEIQPKKPRALSRLMEELTFHYPAKQQEILAFFIKAISKKKGLVIEIEEAKKSRSRQQERYYRKWCAEFAKHCGMFPDEMHEELLCRAFGSETVETKMGVVRRPHQRSGDVGVRDYARLIDVLISTAGELGFRVPPAFSDE